MQITALHTTTLRTTPYEIPLSHQDYIPIDMGESLDVLDFLPHRIWDCMRVFWGGNCYYTRGVDWAWPARSINAAGLEIIQAHYLPQALCRGNDCLFGYGTRETLPNYPVCAGDTCSRAQAEEWLTRDLPRTERGVRRALRVALNDNQFSALVSFAHDVSVPVFRASRLLRLLNECLPERAFNELHGWVYHQGQVCPRLLARRMAEKNLFGMCDA